ncbi:MAG: adenosine kinase [Gammaproteobacteria bacterium]|nr:adenosine kinase [Gammaproteobacteria bacterium]MDH3446839.1 adenosine kinase [Gammaproteobacteria bacterium]
MKKFDVYAIGNALVDIEYHVDPHKLVELGIDKGVMTLIDEQHQNSLIAQLGESHESMTCGGSAANTIIALAQMGANTHLDCRVSSDMTGQVFARDLHRSGVHSNLDFKPLPGGVTGKCLVFVTPDADRTMNTFLGVSADLDVDDIDKEAIKHSQYIYIEGYLSSAENTRDAAIEARRIAESRGIKTSLTLSDPNMVRFFRDSIEAMIGEGVDLLFANEDEARELAGSDNLDVAIDLFKKISRSFAITRGKDGALLFDGVDLVEIDPVRVRAVDTLGAGDMFAGAFLYGLSQGMSFQRSGDLASMASARIVTQFGPRLENGQTRALLETFNAGN